MKCTSCNEIVYWSENIQEKTIENEEPKVLLYSDDNMELKVESVGPYQSVPNEVHPKSTQFIRVESGSGSVILDNKIEIKLDVLGNDSTIVPANTLHQIIAGKNGLKFYTIYSPKLE